MLSDCKRPRKNSIVTSDEEDEKELTDFYEEDDDDNNAAATSAAITSIDDVCVHRGLDGREVFVFDPYNPLNREITVEEVQTLLRRYGVDIPIFNEQLYKRAFVHRSYVRRPHAENEMNRVVLAEKPDTCLPLRTKSNETLEFVGDGVLDCIAKMYLYRRFPKQNEGFMTEKKIALVKNESIGKMALEMGLNRWFVLSKHAEQKQTRNNLKKLGCLFEAFVGALFLDFNKIQVHDRDGWFEKMFLVGPGFQAAQIFIERVFETHVDWVKLIRDDENYKNILQIRMQKEFKVTPFYLEYKPQDNERGFHMGVYLCIGQPIFGLTHADSVPLRNFSSFADIHALERAFVFLSCGSHKIKKKAEQIACENALQELNNITPPQI